jgi:peptidyl-prolyl cis-trans isomerase SurA
MKTLRFGLAAAWAVAVAVCTGPEAAAQTPSPTGAPYVVKVGDTYVPLADFDHIFRKNNRDGVATAEALDAYMELFINFKLKVLEAQAQGLDTADAFRKELAGYRSQLARPYLVDTTLLGDLVEEAWQRSREEVRARHILVNCAENASPADTLAAWKRADALRKRILTGEDFGTVARSKGGSDDPSVKDNGGDLGWFTAFQMVYPFETAAYTTPVGQISQLVRTRYGYHILEVTGRRSAQGEVRVAHILVRSSASDDKQKQAQAEQRIREIHGLVAGGTGWNEMALKYSEDGTSASKGGELPWFGTGRMVEEFETAAFALQVDGEISQPFRTSYGWHIVKRLEFKGPPAFETVRKDIEKKVSKDSRAQMTRDSFIAQLKKEYSFALQASATEPLRKLAFATDSAFYEGHSLPALAAADRGKILLTLGGQRWTVGDFADFLATTRVRNPEAGPAAVLDAQLKLWSEQRLLDHEDARLETKHNDFRLLMEEYHDGILLFELTDQLVWSRAVKDSAGLAAFHAAHADRFMWGPRADVRIFTCRDADIAAEVRKTLRKGGDIAARMAELTATSALAVRLEEGRFEAGVNPWADKVLEEQAAGTLTVSRKGPTFREFSAGGNEVILVEIRGVSGPEAKSLAESRGPAIAAYQDHLEAEWIAQLRAKYPVTVYREALHSLAGR